MKLSKEEILKKFGLDPYARIGKAHREFFTKMIEDIFIEAEEDQVADEDVERPSDYAHILSQ